MGEKLLDVFNSSLERRGSALIISLAILTMRLLKSSTDYSCEAVARFWLFLPKFIIFQHAFDLSEATKL